MRTAKRSPYDPEACHEMHIAFLEKMGDRIEVLEASPLGTAARLLRVAFECHRQNATDYRDAGFRISTGTRMIRSGQIGIVFCAAALECAISTALAALCMGTKPLVQRGLLMELVVGLRNKDAIRALRRFFPDLKLFDRSELQELFTSRNEILHARPEYYEDYVMHVARDGPPRTITKWSKSLRLPPTESATWVIELPKYLDLAVQIVEDLVIRLQTPLGGKLPKMRKDHPITKMRELEAKHGGGRHDRSGR
jgi:hypothetical protein